ncbi:hypothetical protein BJP44_02205 [Candidatus Williamhamiltonella defendens]|uniref:Uncharacterized protein n=2 Tax=Candidatus Williamhamiltonella defendens TaxID=138072 RepID=C4K3T6_HAMD5|nr:hypothetical protein HDEF_0475 [Candidatus Hamiltonella defensa 5AT (Acyrthosiphon pisum)]ATW21985.1 hypothetical protein BJP44_02205 [Candidatus Hamiltonella defensa]ATW33227.1 hypothetical protein BJP43_01805 [Candidatus Hamiltonella defensa]AYB49241.1 hypothetical protein CJJ19_06815 [Candidatus Hamiltonella defensa]
MNYFFRIVILLIYIFKKLIFLFSKRELIKIYLFYPQKKLTLIFISFILFTKRKINSNQYF